MLICCWSSKGGVGTTVVAGALAIVLSRTSLGGAVLADLAGDLPVVLGLPDEPDNPGLAGWLAAGPHVPADGLARLEVPVRPGLSLLARGPGPMPGARAEVLAGLLASESRPVVADAGTLGFAPGPGVGTGSEVGLAIAGAATHSLLVLRPCFVALRRAINCPLRPSGVVLVAEEGRALTAGDVEGALGVPVRATVRVTPQVARTVDAGLLASRLPRTLAADLGHAA